MKEKTLLKCIEKTKKTNFLVNVIKINEDLYDTTIACKSCNRTKIFQNQSMKSVWNTLRERGHRAHFNCRCRDRFKILQNFCINKNFTLLDEFEKLHHTKIYKQGSNLKLKFECNICKSIYFKLWGTIRQKENNGCQQCAFNSYKGVPKGKGNPKKVFNSDLYTRQERSDRLLDQSLDISILKEDPLYENYLNDTYNYNVDHIFPRMAFIDFNMDNMFDYDFLKAICNSRENLQILTKNENISKSGKYDKQEFLLWISKKYNH